MALLTNAAVTGIANFIKLKVAYARYKIGSTYYQTDIDKVVGANGVITIDFRIRHEVPGQFTVSEVQLFDDNNDLWLSKTEGIVQAGTIQSTLYRVTITIVEV